MLQDTTDRKAFGAILQLTELVPINLFVCIIVQIYFFIALCCKNLGLTTISKTLTVIIGNGYLSGFLIPLCMSADVLAISRGSRRPKRGEGLACANQIGCDVFSTDSIKELHHLLQGRICEMYCLLPPSAYGGRSPDIVLAPLFRILRTVNIKRVVLASSSGVYGHREREVFRLSDVNGTTARASFFLKIENTWCRFFASTQIVRLAGLYGPKRIVGKVSIESGKLISGARFGWLNFVRIEDAAQALRAFMIIGPTEQVHLISDGVPVIRADYDQYLHELMGGQGASQSQLFFEKNERGRKKCNPQSSWGSINRKPLFLSYKEGLSDMFNRAGQ